MMKIAGGKNPEPQEQHKIIIKLIPGTYPYFANSGDHNYRVPEVPNKIPCSTQQQLPHARIDQWKPGLTPLPAPQGCRIRVPRLHAWARNANATQPEDGRLSSYSGWYSDNPHTTPTYETRIIPTINLCKLRWLCIVNPKP